VASEALQCPTLLLNGFGAHRIEGIGDKHVPWIHNVKNTDMVVAIDDAATMALIRLFNEPAGSEYLVQQGVPTELVCQLPLLGISSIANLLSAIKFAKYYELTENDVVATLATDSMDLYRSRLGELEEAEGPFGRDRCGRGLQPLPAGRKHRQPAGAFLPGPQARPQPEVLHLGRAAGQKLRRDPGPVVRRRLLDPTRSTKRPAF
jgi:hypothetical protein